MTVLGSAAAVYAGGVRASAVYAGAVKVWPAGLPEATGVAYWADGVSLRLVFPTMPTTGSAVFDVVAAPSPLLHPDRTLGGTTVGGTGTQSVVWFGTETGAGVNVTDAAWRGVHNGDAATRLGGMRVEVTRSGSTVTRLDALGPSPTPLGFGVHDNALALVVGTPEASLRVPRTPVTLVLSASFRTYAAGHAASVPVWTDAAGVSLPVRSAGGQAVTYAEAVAASAGPAALRFDDAASAWTLEAAP